MKSYKPRQPHSRPTDGSDTKIPLKGAVSEYLRHQLSRTRKLLEKRTDRRRVHQAAVEVRRQRSRKRSLVDKLTLAILGQNEAYSKERMDQLNAIHSSSTHNEAHFSNPSSSSPANGGGAVLSDGEKRIMHVVGLLQREISLDTKAIAAFRNHLDKKHAPAAAATLAVKPASGGPPKAKRS